MNRQDGPKFNDMKRATYLGDGLYAEDEGHQIRLFCERENGTHEVFVGDLHLLFAFIEKMRGVTITVTKP
jgi:hypothetical protein